MELTDAMGLGWVGVGEIGGAARGREQPATGGGGLGRGKDEDGGGTL